MLDTLLAPFNAVAEMRVLGGPVVDWIFISCILMWVIVIERYWYFARILPGEIVSSGLFVLVEEILLHEQLIYTRRQTLVQRVPLGVRRG